MRPRLFVHVVIVVLVFVECTCHAHVLVHVLGSARLGSARPPKSAYLTRPIASARRKLGIPPPPRQAFPAFPHDSAPAQTARHWSAASKLLRVLQEREVQPLGSTKVEKIDVRLLASTHRDLLAEVKAGRFREDLYYRVAVVELHVPSLRERREDIPLLAREFARKYSERFGLDNVVQLAPEFIELLQRAPWPGNMRQLENAIARCVALATGSVIGPAAFELINGLRSAAKRLRRRMVCGLRGRRFASRWRRSSETC